MFKYGDDLRQDNLVLQFFRIMDEMWMEKNMNMEMVRYKVLETGYEVGYIEFVDNSDVITSMHKWRGFWKGPFEERSIYDFFKQEVYPKIFKAELNKLIEDNKEKGKKPKLGYNAQQSFVAGAKMPNDEDKEDDDPYDRHIIQAMKNTDKKLKKMHKTYINSTAG